MNIFSHLQNFLRIAFVRVYNFFRHLSEKEREDELNQTFQKIKTDFKNVQDDHNRVILNNKEFCKVTLEKLGKARIRNFHCFYIFIC